MRNPENVLISLTEHSKQKDYKYERLYRLLYNEEMYLIAYQNIYSNDGSMTKGTDKQTVDGMSIERIQKIILSLKDESYQPKPARRTYIPKKNGKLRPLGIPSFEDKLLQEVIRMILEAIYEGYFEQTSHGFRPNRSCHTALNKIQKTFTGVKWFIEGDIKGFFDNINHNTLIGIMRERINIRELEKERVNIPQSDPMDSGYARLHYVRYADDWLCGVIGSKKDCITIKEDFKKFLSEKLQLELSEEKTLITNAQKSAKFLSYEIRIRNSNLTKRDKVGRLVRNYTGRVVLEVSSDTIKKHLINTGAMKMIYHNGKEIWKPKALYRLKDCDDLEILDYYNSMIRGFYNYYCIANNSSIINSYKYIMEYSMYKTYDTKYRTSIHKVIEKFRVGKNFAVKFHNAKGIENMRVFYNQGFKRQKKAFLPNEDSIPNSIKYFSSTNLIDRLKAKECEICGKTNTPIEIHHIHRLKNLQGKSFWETLMIARKRKTLALCRSCHKKLHCGQLN